MEGIEQKYTYKEMTKIMDKAGFPKGLSLSQMFKIAYWSMFNLKKLRRFCYNIERGMSLHFSFKDATDYLNQQQSINKK